MEEPLAREMAYGAREIPPEMAECLAAQRDLWIFAYGSLMWDPGFAYAEAQPALLRGYHRSFCVYSHRHRGTPERPGIVLGLDRGGACRGIAYRVPAADLRDTLCYLWDREMARGTYRLKQVRIELPAATVRARVFAVDRKREAYAGRLSLDAVVGLILQGTGGRGSCRQYLENTVRELRKLGVVDGPLHRLEQIVEDMAAREIACR